MNNINYRLFQGVLALCRPKFIPPLNIFENGAMRYSSYRSHRDWNPESKVTYEVSSDANEWKYVERLLPEKYIPEPSPKDNYTSGWWPQNPEFFKNEQYVVCRSKNHMLPVYLRIGSRGLRKTTVVRHIRGDIWALERDLKKHIEKKMNKRSIGTRVDELAGKIIFKGDFVYYISEWFKEKGL